MKTTAETPAEAAARESAVCICQTPKEPGQLVCWHCFKHRTDAAPLKDFPGDYEAWANSLPQPPLSPETTTMKPESTPLKTKNDALQLADQLAVAMVAINSLKADETSRLNKVKAFFKGKIEIHTKQRDRVKKRLIKWIENNAKTLFGADTGTASSAMMEISLSKNPPAITQLDPDASEADLINLAREKGFEFVVKMEASISKDALGGLTDEELEQIGFHRVQSKTVALKLIVDKSKSETAKAEAA